MNILKSPSNAFGVAQNPYQGKDKRVLCVCAAGCLRSPTLANVLHIELGYNTRAVGADRNFALIPLSEALVAWADEIVFVDQDAYDYLWQEDKELIEEWDVKVLTLNIPDNYPFMDDDLQQECLEQYISNNCRRIL